MTTQEVMKLFEKRLRLFGIAVRMWERNDGDSGFDDGTLRIRCELGGVVVQNHVTKEDRCFNDVHTVRVVDSVCEFILLSYMRNFAAAPTEPATKYSNDAISRQVAEWRDRYRGAVGVDLGNGEATPTAEPAAGVVLMPEIE